MQCVQVDSTAGSVTESLQARVGQNPEHAQLLSEHRRMEKGRKELESQVNPLPPSPLPHTSPSQEAAALQPLKPPPAFFQQIVVLFIVLMSHDPPIVLHSPTPFCGSTN